MAKINKPVLILGSAMGMNAQMLTSLEDKVEFKTHESYMEEKIKSAKELKIKAVKAEEQIASTEEPILNGGAKKDWDRTHNSIPLTNKQAKARAKNKRAKKARKINR